MLRRFSFAWFERREAAHFPRNVSHGLPAEDP